MLVSNAKLPLPQPNTTNQRPSFFPTPASPPPFFSLLPLSPRPILSPVAPIKCQAGARDSPTKERDNPGSKSSFEIFVIFCSSGRKASGGHRTEKPSDTLKKYSETKFCMLSSTPRDVLCSRSPSLDARTKLDRHYVHTEKGRKEGFGEELQGSNNE